jgi:hypothetical protein
MNRLIHNSNLIIVSIHLCKINKMELLIRIKYILIFLIVSLKITFNNKKIWKQIKMILKIMQNKMSKIVYKV